MTLTNASIVRLSNSTRCLQAKESIQSEDVIDSAIAIQQIPAPTFDERDRAMYVAQQFAACGLQDIQTDDLHNVIGWHYSAAADAPILLIAAHLDTVFPADTSLEVYRNGSRVYGAGLGDNSLGVAALLHLARIFSRHDLPHTAHLCFSANSCEEGLGNLRGINGVIDLLPALPAAAVVIEGMALGRIYHAGIAVRRFKVEVSATGGHSWLHFGNASAIHSLMRFGAEMTTLKMPDHVRSTYNIGLVDGGNSINSIASQASCYIDLRSVSTEILNQLEADVRGIAARHESDEVAFHFETVGDRPAGGISADHPLVRLAQEAHQAIGMRPELESGSTDANALLARGIPTVCVGVSYGGNAHTTDEYIETAPIEKGMWQLLLLTIAAANALPAWSRL